MSGALQAVFRNLRSFGPPSGQQVYTGAGTYTFIIPAGTTRVSYMVIGGGACGDSLSGAGPNCWVGGTGGSGGSRVWATNKTVVPGTSYTMFIGGGANQYATAFCNGGTPLKIQAGCRTIANGYSTGTYRIKGASGGQGGQCACASVAGGGGGGAAGFINDSDTDGAYPACVRPSKGGVGGNYAAGGGGVGYCGGAGGGAAGGRCGGTAGRGGGGGGTSLLGRSYTGSSALGGAAASGGGNGGAGGGTGGGSSGSGINGGGYGGGGGGASASTGVQNTRGVGSGSAGIRIMWPGCTRFYPATNTNDV